MCASISLQFASLCFMFQLPEDMGTFQGHFLPGIFFLTYGLWMTYKSLEKYFLCRCSGQKKNAYRNALMSGNGCYRGMPIEEIVMLLMNLIGISGIKSIQFVWPHEPHWDIRYQKYSVCLTSWTSLGYQVSKAFSLFDLMNLIGISGIKSIQFVWPHEPHWDIRYQKHSVCFTSWTSLGYQVSKAFSLFHLMNLIGISGIKNIQFVSTGKHITIVQFVSKSNFNQLIYNNWI